MKQLVRLFTFSSPFYGELKGQAGASDLLQHRLPCNLAPLGTFTRWKSAVQICHRPPAISNCYESSGALAAKPTHLLTHLFQPPLIRRRLFSSPKPYRQTPCLQPRMHPSGYGHTGPSSLPTGAAISAGLLVRGSLRQQAWMRTGAGWNENQTALRLPSCTFAASYCSHRNTILPFSD